MEGHRPRRQIALDSNILFDLANGFEASHVFREILLERGYALRVPPTVIQELVHLSSIDDPAAPPAAKALRSMRSWSLVPFDLISVGHGITEQFARSLIQKGFLPPEEFNDGLILGETALADIPVLVTYDHHLLDIGQNALAVTFQDSDLALVTPMHPCDLLRVLE